MSTYWEQLTRPHESLTGIEERRQSVLLSIVTLGLGVAVFFLGIAGIWLVITLQASPVGFFSLFLMGIGVAIAFYLNRKGQYKQAAYITVISMLVAVISVAFINRNPGVLSSFMMVILLITSVLFRWRENIAVFMVALAAGLTYALTHPALTSVPTSGSFIFLSLGAPILFGIMHYRNQLERERQQELRLTNEKLRESEVKLEERVRERTRDLEIAADVARQITTNLDLKTLLEAIVERTKAGFNLYHVSIFLYDEDTERVTLEAGAGEVGKIMKAEGKHFNVPKDLGLVPTSVRERRAVVINNVAEESKHFRNPHLPKTQSEVALPMLYGDKMIGVLDLQSEALHRFSEDDVRIMATLAEQIAIAVNNAQLYEEQVGIAEQLREVDEIKSRFLASMSHELRTPLNAILNFTKFVSSGMLGEVNEKQVEALNKATSSGKHLLSLINDVLDITKIESGMLQLFVEGDFDLPSELDTLAATAETLLAEKPEVHITRQIAPELPSIVADKRRIRQILLNLVSNACKFTEAGTIAICAEVQGDEVVVSVKDTGPGIAPEDQASIFESFRQTKVGMSEGGGTGLGLAIAKHLAEAHGGDLWVESTVDVGTTFFLRVPIASEILKAQILV